MREGESGFASSYHQLAFPAGEESGLPVQLSLLGDFCCSEAFSPPFSLGRVLGNCSSPCACSWPLILQGRFSLKTVADLAQVVI